MTTRLARALLALVAATIAVLAVGIGTVSAHLSVGSPDATAGGFGELTFRVPTESDTASTVSLRVQLPTDTPLAFVSVKPVPGWTATTETAPIDPPVTVEGSEITEAVSQITWTADPGAGIRAGEYQTFSLGAGPLPGADSLVLPAIQGYDDGTEVAWVEPSVEGQAEPEHPAPTLTLASGDEATAPPAPGASAAPGDDSGAGLAVTALVVGLAGLLAGVVGVVLALGAHRRRDDAPAAETPERERVDA